MTNQEFYESLPPDDSILFSPAEPEAKITLVDLAKRVERLERARKEDKERIGEASRRTADNLAELTEVSQRDTFRNLVTNGDFSDPAWSGTGAPPGWTATAAGPPTIAQNTSVPSDCSGKGVSMTCAAADAGIYQAITVLGGKAYTVCFRFKGNNNAVGRVNITTNGTDPINNNNDITPSTVPAQWERTGETIEQITYETPSDATTLTIGLYTSSATPVILDYAEVSMWEGTLVRQYSKKVLDESSTQIISPIEISSFSNRSKVPEGLAGGDLDNVYPNPDVRFDKGILANRVFG